MKLSIRTSGGFGGIGLGKHKELSLDAMSEEDRAAVEALIDRAAAAEGFESTDLPQPDAISYTLALEDGDEDSRSVEIAESGLDDSELDLLDRLMARKED